MKPASNLRSLALKALFLTATALAATSAHAQVFGDLRPGVPGAPGMGGPGGGGHGGAPGGGGWDDGRGGGRDSGRPGDPGHDDGRGHRAPDRDWDFCARENQACNVRGTFDIAYGANGRFIYRQNVDVRNGFQCNNQSFGDPIQGIEKACFIKRSRGPIGGGPGGWPGGPGWGGGPGGGGPRPPAPPARWTYCAREGETCFVGRSAVVRYGAQGRYNQLNVRDRVACDNRTFGDPAKGQAKICEYSIQ